MKFITIECQPKLLGRLILSIALILLVIGLWAIPRNTLEKQNEVAQQVEPVPLESIAEPAKMKMHSVQDGETLSAIAEKYGIDVDTLQSANENLNSEIHQGDQLIILPSKGVLYTVDMGDTLWRIAHVYGIDVATITKANAKVSTDLSIGEKIFIPGGKKIQQNDRQLARAEPSVSRGGNQRFIYPTTGELSSGFGYRWGRLHSGIDLANDIGTPIKTARSGRVIHAGWYSGYGYTVIVEHDQGYTTLYGHLSEYIVQNGQYVKEGQVIAYMGSTGNSTGPHLHFEVWKNGTPINPYNVLP
ncbi:peptidoglycan DD-metalloendopeptidase family protein [Pelosinus sp. sgz500959]|uniref:peptidoglycan DD-metalloendopeptidase family protein n=1 Tax=Pelosinus sp. sgz500959 TaxID=3242472 RepID=UPI00366C3173